MTLTLNLTPETEAWLKEEADRTGKSPEELALEALKEKVAYEAESAAVLPASSWLTEFHSWLAAHPASTAAVLDDSRETIYEGRGE